MMETPTREKVEEALNRLTEQSDAPSEVVCEGALSTLESALSQLKADYDPRKPAGIVYMAMNHVEKAISILSQKIQF